MSGGSIELERALARVALGDQQAFRRLYQLTSAHLMGVAFRIVKRRDLAEEVLQEVYVSVWRQAYTYRPALAKPMTWLITMVRNRCIDLVRSPRFVLERSSESLSEPAGEEADESVSRRAVAEADEMAARALDASRANECLALLSPPHRQSLALAYYQGLSHSEVATHMDAPVGSVKVWIRRGLDHLRRCLDLAA